MGFRSLVEINHDYNLDDSAFLRALVAYLGSGSSEDARELERFGIKVIGIRHHSEPYRLENMTYRLENKPGRGASGR